MEIPIRQQKRVSFDIDVNENSLPTNHCPDEVQSCCLPHISTTDMRKGQSKPAFRDNSKSTAELVQQLCRMKTVPTAKLYDMLKPCSPPLICTKDNPSAKQRVQSIYNYVDTVNSVASLVPMNTLQAKTSPMDNQLQPKSCRSKSIQHMSMTGELKSAYLAYKSRRGLVEKSVLTPKFSLQEGYGKVPKYLQQCKMKDLRKYMKEQMHPANDNECASTTKRPIVHYKKNFVKAAKTQEVAPSKQKPIYVDWGGNRKVHEDSVLIPNYAKKKGYGEVPQYLLQRKVKELERYLKKQQCLSYDSTRTYDALPTGVNKKHLSNRQPPSPESLQPSQDNCLLEHSAGSTVTTLTGYPTAESTRITKKPPIFTRGDTVPLIIHHKKNFLQAAKEQELVPTKPKLTDVDWNGNRKVIKDSVPIPNYVKKTGYGEVPHYLMKRKMREHKKSMKENGWHTNLSTEEEDNLPIICTTDTSVQQCPSNYGCGDTGESLPTLADDYSLPTKQSFEELPPVSTMNTPSAPQSLPNDSCEDAGESLPPLVDEDRLPTKQSLEELPPVSTMDTPPAQQSLPNDSCEDAGEALPPLVDEDRLPTKQSLEELPLSSSVGTPSVEQSPSQFSCEDAGVSLVVILEDEDSMPTEQSLEVPSLSSPMGELSSPMDTLSVEQSPPNCEEADISLLPPLLEEDSLATKQSLKELPLNTTMDTTSVQQCHPDGDTHKCDSLPAGRSSKNAIKETTKEAKVKPSQGKNVKHSAKTTSSNVTECSKVERTRMKQKPPVTRADSTETAKKKGEVPHYLQRHRNTEPKEAEQQRCPKGSTVKEKRLVKNLIPLRNRQQPNHIRPFRP